MICCCRGLPESGCTPFAAGRAMEVVVYAKDVFRWRVRMHA